MCTIHFCILNCLQTLTEQHAKKQQDMDVISEETSDLNTKILESPVEATQSQDSVTLSLVDDSSELILQDIMPEEVTADSKRIEEEENFNEYTTGIGIHG